MIIDSNLYQEVWVICMNRCRYVCPVEFIGLFIAVYILILFFFVFELCYLYLIMSMCNTLTNESLILQVKFLCKFKFNNSIELNSMISMINVPKNRATMLKKLLKWISRSLETKISIKSKNPFVLHPWIIMF